MSEEVRFVGEVELATAEAALRAVRAIAEAISDAEDCDSFLAADDLNVNGKRVALDKAGSCPPSMWEAAMGLLTMLFDGEANGSIECVVDGQLVDTLTAAYGRDRDQETPAPTAPDPSGLRWAAQIGDVDALIASLAAGSDPSAADPSSIQHTTPLMMAAYHGQANAVRLLLAAGAAVDARDWVGNTALFYAAHNKHKRGRKQVLRLLLAAGASPAARNDSGVTAEANARELKAFGGADELATSLRG